MKKQFLFLAGCAVILASCGSNNNTAGQTQAQIDSIANANVAAHNADNAAKNDSTLKAIEKEKAEAIAKEHEAKHEEHEARKAESTTPAAAPAAAAPAPSPVNVRPGANGPKSVNDRPGAH